MAPVHKSMWDVMWIKVSTTDIQHVRDKTFLQQEKWVYKDC